MRGRAPRGAGPRSVDVGLDPALAVEQRRAVGARPQGARAEEAGLVVGGVVDRQRDDRPVCRARAGCRCAGRDGSRSGSSRCSPRSTTRWSVSTSGGAWAASTSKVEATARWSEPQRSRPMSTSGPPQLTDETARDGGGRAARDHPVDAVDRLLLADAWRRCARRPGEAGREPRIGVGLAVGVAEAGAGQRPRDGPGKRLVEVRGRVEVARPGTWESPPSESRESGRM